MAAMGVRAAHVVASYDEGEGWRVGWGGPSPGSWHTGGGTGGGAQRGLGGWGGGTAATTADQRVSEHWQLIKL